MSDERPSGDERRQIGQEFARGMRGPMRWSLLGAVAVVLLIGAFFFIKAGSLAQSRGELGIPSRSTAKSAALPPDFADLCLLAQFMNVESLNQRVSAIAETATRGGRTVSWERTGNGMIVRINWADQLANENHEMGIELVRTAKARVLPDCDGAKEGAVATRINVDGEIVSGLAVGVALQESLPQTTNSPDPAAANDRTSDGLAATRSGHETFTPEQQQLVDVWQSLEGQCRGDPSDEAALERDCHDRDAAMDRMNAAGVCWGKDGQYEAEYEVHLCGPGSLGYHEAQRASIDAM